MHSDPTGSTIELAGALRPAVLRLGRRLRQVQAGPYELTSSQLSALAVLLNGGDQLMGELAALEQVRPPSMTRIVDGLQERGLVTRQPSPGDRRQCVVALTELGREVLMANRRRRDEWLAVRLAELDPTEREVLHRAAGILERMNHP